MTVTAPHPDSTEVLLARGVMEYLAALDLVEWRENQTYTDAAGQACGFLGSVPDQPDRLLTLTPYTIADDARDTMSLVGLQARTRWAGSNWRAVANYSAAIFDALHGLGPVTLATGIRLSQCLRQSSATLGQEAVGAKRWSWSDNYYVDLDRPGAHRAGS